MIRFIVLGMVVLGLSSPVWAEDWAIGGEDPNEVVHLTEDRYVDGDVLVGGSATLSIEGSRLTITGNLIVWGQAPQLIVNNGELRFLQQFSYDSEIKFFEGANADFDNSQINGNGHSISIVLLDKSTLDFNTVEVVDGFLTWALFGTAEATLNHCTNSGEFLPLQNNKLIIRDSSVVLFWLNAVQGSVVHVMFPNSGHVDSWVLNDESTWAHGIPYEVEITDCEQTMWALMSWSGSDTTVENSTIRVSGAVFDRDNTIEISGLANSVTCNDHEFQWGDVKLRYINTQVQTWNFYAYGTTDLTIRKSVIGELLVEGDTTCLMEDSLCDGTGGYIGVTANGHLKMVRSTNLSQTTTSKNGELLVIHSSLLNPTIDAIDNSRMFFMNAKYMGTPRAKHAASILDAYIEPTFAEAGETVELYGSARVIGGPDSPFTFERYWLSIGNSFDQQEDTVPITDPVDTPVRYGLLGSFDTCALNPGDYSVYVSFDFGWSGAVMSVASPLVLSESYTNPSHVGDFNCDGHTDLADYRIFADCISGPDSDESPAACDPLNFFYSDLDHDGDVDTQDFSLLQAQMN